MSETEKAFALSHAQRQIWRVERSRPGSAVNHVAVLARHPGGADVEHLREAARAVFTRHDALRLRLHHFGSEDPSGVRQSVAAPGDVRIEERYFGTNRGEEEMEQWARQRARTPFDLEGGPLAEIVLLRSDEGRPAWFFKAHFLACDPYSARAVFSQVLRDAEALSRGGPAGAPEAAPFESRVQKELDYLAGPEGKADAAWWEDRFRTPPEAVSPTFSTERAPTPRAGALRRPAPPGLSALFREQAPTDAALEDLVLAASAAYCRRALGVEDFVLGLFLDGRVGPRAEETVGCHLNAVPVRLQVRDGEPFGAFVERVGAARADARRHGRLPFDVLSDSLQSAWNQSPAFLLNWCVTVVSSEQPTEVEIEILGSAEKAQPLTLFVRRERDGQVIFDWQFQEDLYTIGHVEALHWAVTLLLEGGLRSPGTPFDALPFVSPEDRALLDRFNSTEVPYDVERTFVSLFAETAARHPDRPAVRFREKILTYRELDEKSNALARRLRELGAARNGCVGILLDPCLEMPLGLLAIQKAGAAYLPVDPAYPPDRVRYMLEDGAVPALLTQRHLAGKAGFEGPVLLLDADETFTGDPSPLPPVNDPGDAAYVIYTSGTTGKPKGVEISHRSLVHLCRYQADFEGMTPEDRQSKFAGFAFDASVIEFFPILSAGGCLVVVPAESRLSPRDVNACFEENGVTLSILPTQFAEQFMELCDNRTLRCLEMGGDKLRSVRKRPYRIVNAYGPTEYTVEATRFEVTRPWANIPIGRPVPNTRVYILDPAGREQPPGAAGELCVSGLGTARGYRNRPELTAEKFIPDPFRHGFRAYRTGDLARWLPDGNLEFLGRIDFQVKVRGFRVELGEIEAQLLLVPGVKDAVVTARGEGGDHWLCAYVVTETDLSDDAVREALAKPLPAYMIPARIVRLPVLPLTPNGKVDRRALPDPGPPVDRDRPVKAPSTPTEAKLVELWQGVLGVSRFGVDENFFSLGGHSLRAVMLQAAMEKAFGVQLPLQALFDTPTVEGQAARVESGSTSPHARLVPVPEREFYPASSAQKRLYAVESMGRSGLSYNLPMVLRIDGPLDAGRLAAAVEALTERHASFRTGFELHEGEPVQRVRAHVKVRMVRSEASPDEVTERFRAFVRPFDLARPPLFRVELLKLGPDAHVLLFDAHHIIFDGLSVGILLNELLDLYVDRGLPPLPLQYRDFAVWQDAARRSGAFADQKAYWTDRFREEPPRLEIPVDFPRGAFGGEQGDVFVRAVPGGLSAAVDRLAGETGTTAFMVYLAAYAALLGRYTSQEDVVVGVPSSGRVSAALQGIIGMFVNSLPLRLATPRAAAFRDLLSRVRDAVLGGYDNQDYPLDDLIDTLGLPREAGRNPLFETMFSIDDFAGEVSSGDLRLHMMVHETRDAQFDLALELALSSAGAYTLRLEYRRDLFLPETARRFAEHYLRFLERVTSAPETPLGDIDILSAEERRLLLETFNDTAMDVPSDKLLHQLVEEQAARRPDRTALVDGDTHYTYAALNARANALAHRLRGELSGKGPLVGLRVERGADGIAAMLAVLKAGGAYVPIDPHYPPERVLTILEDAGAALLLTQRSLRPSVTFGGTVWELDEASLWSGGTANPSTSGTPADMAYVIYTSGSTGKPKGVMIPHRGVVNLVTWHARFHGLTPDDVCAEYASFSFDASVVEIFSPLAAGACLHVLPEGVRLDLGALNRYLETHGVTYTDLPTQLCEAFMENTDNRSLRRLSTGSEKLKKFTPRNYVLVDEYGPTEYTVDATAFVVERPHAKSPIGRPVANTRVYILDPGGKLLPVGVPGELCIAGAQLALGYLNRPELTAEKFVEDPFRPGERMYRTGDLARWLPDGNVDFIGRKDFQVKIRGFRIELEEIESRLRQVGGVENAVVLAKTDAGGNAFLVGYLQSAAGLDLEAVKRELATGLPDYMVPAVFVRLAAFPLNVSGKVDRKALPEPEQVCDAAVVHVAPRNPVEAAVAAAWEKVLGLSDVGVYDNFFSLGGHSLKAVALVALLQKEFEVTVNDVFTAQTVAELALRVKPLQDNIRLRLEALRTLGETAKAEPEVPSGLEGAMAEYRRRIADEAALDPGPPRGWGDVLVTGATGFLGAYLVRDLVEGRVPGANPGRVRTVVRADSAEQAARRLADKLDFYFGKGWFAAHRDRLDALPGDLGSPNLGLGDAAYADLASGVEAIFHPAALVKHYGLREEFEKANVTATANLLALARTGRPKAFHHMSTLSVGWGDVPGVSQLLFTEYTGDVGQRSGNLYLETKLEAEGLVRQAMRDGVPASIYRLGNITFDSETGRCQENIGDNGFFQQVRAYVNLGAVPDLYDRADLSFVDGTSRAVLTLALRPGLTGQTWHVLNPEAVSLCDVLTAGYGRRVGFGRLNVAPLRFRHFVDRLIGHYGQSGFREYIENLLLHQGWLETVGEGKTAPPVDRVDRTAGMLERLGFTWPALDPARMRPLLTAALGDRVRFLRSCPNLSPLEAEDLEEMAALARLEHFRDGDDLYWEGETLRRVFVVQEGVVEIARRSREGWHGVLGVRGPGDLVGLTDLTANRPVRAIATAILGDVRALAFRTDDLRETALNRPRLILALMRALGRRVDDLEALLVDMG